MDTVPIKPLKPWFQTTTDIGPKLDWQQFFGNDQPVEIDIGCGRGLFLFNAAVTTPETNFVGLEIDFREGRRTAMRLLKRDLPNARVIGGDGKMVLTDMVTPGTVHAAHILFPDPWWKKRHQKRRMFNVEFTQLLAQILKPDGLVHHWTDVADYFEMATALMDVSPYFERQPEPPQRDAEHDMDYHTSFERKKRKLGLPIYRAVWKRNTVPLDVKLSASE